MLLLKPKFWVLGVFCVKEIGDFPETEPLALSRLTELFFFFFLTCGTLLIRGMSKVCLELLRNS